MPDYPNYNYGVRPDWTYKGPGFAHIELPDGGFMSEYSAGPVDNLYPTVYEGITPWDMETLRMDAMSFGHDPLFQEVADRAYEAALVRAMQGKPPFWTPGEPETGTPYQGRYRPRLFYPELYGDY